jgi:hypothetical protein
MGDSLSYSGECSIRTASPAMIFATATPHWVERQRPRCRMGRKTVYRRDLQPVVRTPGIWDARWCQVQKPPIDRVAFLARPAQEGRDRPVRPVQRVRLKRPAVAPRSRRQPCSVQACTGHVQMLEALNAFTVQPGRDGQHVGAVEPDSDRRPPSSADRETGMGRSPLTLRIAAILSTSSPADKTASLPSRFPLPSRAPPHRLHVDSREFKTGF